MNTFINVTFEEKSINELLVKLINTYPLYIQEPDRIKDIINRFKLAESDDFTVIVETDHVDRQYRDSYYSYFSQKYSRFERNCLRLVFFKNNVSIEDFTSNVLELQKQLIGTIVLRPLNVGNIGCSLLDPKKLNITGYIQTCTFKLMICGRKFVIKAFPYLSQDNETMTCAETALYNLIQYYSEKYCEYRILMPSEILKTLEDSSYERVLPSHGLDDVFMAKVLQYGHFYPRLYSYDLEEGHCFDEIFYSYIESGIPFIFGLPQHAVICIGHSDIDYKIEHHNLNEIVSSEIIDQKKVFSLCTSRLIDKFIFMDDNQSPYVISGIDDLTVHYAENIDLSSEYDSEEISEEILSADELDEGEEDSSFDRNTNYSKEAINKMKKRFDSLLVPLYKRIFLDASRAKSIFDEHFLRNTDFLKKLQIEYSDPTWGSNIENPLVWRMFLASSNSYKDFKCKTSPNIDIYKYYSTQSYPRFVWVMEISSISDYSKKKARVEIILDATSSRNSDTWAILSVCYRNHMVFVPYITDMIGQESTGKLTDFDYSSIEWDVLGKDIKKNPMTEMFKSLYYNENNIAPATFDIYINSNLKEI